MNTDKNPYLSEYEGDRSFDYDKLPKMIWKAKEALENAIEIFKFPVHNI